MIKTPLGRLTIASTVGLSVFFGAVKSVSACTLPGGSGFFNFPRWWKYLDGTMIAGTCTPTVIWPGGIWAIGLAILDILLRVAGLAAVISLIVASVMYITSAGDTNRTSAALNRIINSLVGLAIVLVAAGVVAFIGNRIG